MKKNVKSCYDQHEQSLRLNLDNKHADKFNISAVIYLCRFGCLYKVKKCVYGYLFVWILGCIRLHLSCSVRDRRDTEE